MDEAKLNKRAWNEEAKRKNYWTVEVKEEEVDLARNGILHVWLTPTKFLDESWTKDLKGKRVLLLASAGGQQSILFSAFGSNVISIDISEEQVKKDLEGFKKYGLSGEAYVSDMRNLKGIEDESVDAVFIPHSINFISSLTKLYSEVDRTLKKGGHFMFGSANPVLYLFDEKKEEKGKLKVKYTLPFSDLKSKSRKEIKKMVKKKDTFESSHTLDAIISPLLERGYSLVRFFSDESGFSLVDSYIHDSFLAFDFLKPPL